jgi:hypothetical protein
MSRKLTAREKLLLGVLAIGGGLSLFALRGDRLGLGGPTDGGPFATGPAGEPPVVRMDLLAREAAEFADGGRNLFDYYTPPPPPPPPYVPPPPAPPPPPRVIKPPPPPRDPGPPPPPKPPLPDFKYLGYLGPKDARLAVFEVDEETEAPLLARVGDVVREDFRLIEFRYESVIFGYTDERFAGRTAELAMEDVD